MKTPIQQIYDHLKATKEGRGYGAEYCIDWLLENESKMLEKEKELACKFARKYDLELGDGIIRLVEDCFDEMFNTEEK